MFKKIFLKRIMQTFIYGCDGATGIEPALWPQLIKLEIIYEAVTLNIGKQETQHYDP